MHRLSSPIRDASERDGILHRLTPQAACTPHNMVIGSLEFRWGLVLFFSFLLCLRSVFLFLKSPSTGTCARTSIVHTGHSVYNGIIDGEVRKVLLVLLPT